ncbi:MAG: hypothetical protein MR904_04375 [Clostridia bacterium]|nr:hypothetical protein [Clostridia bacterium]
MDLVSKFVRLIDRRDALIKMHYGDNLREALIFPEEREWYNENILRIDRKIIITARNILPDERFMEISDVYGNEYLMNKYRKFKEDKAFQK